MNTEGDTFLWALYLKWRLAN